MYIDKIKYIISNDLYTIKNKYELVCFDDEIAYLKMFDSSRAGIYFHNGERIDADDYFYIINNGFYKKLKQNTLEFLNNKTIYFEEEYGNFLTIKNIDTPLYVGMVNLIHINEYGSKFAQFISIKKNKMVMEEVKIEFKEVDDFLKERFDYE